MKRLLLMLLLALLVPLATKADVIEIGSAENMNDFPFHTWTYGAWDEEIYPMSAFSGPCAINAISYNNMGLFGMMYPMAQMASSLKIYMGERESLTHDSETDWTPLSELTLVYSHEDVSLGAECGWEEIVLDDPFVYQLNGNLVVVVATAYDSPAWDVSLTSSSYADGNVSLVYSSWDPGIIEFPSDGGTLFSEFADIQFNVTPLNEVISIGNAENMWVYPFHEYMPVSWDEEIYPMSAFSGPCVINSISYNNVGMYGTVYPTVANTLKIYLGERATATHASETDWTPMSELALVYSHENVVVGNECGWQEFVLDEPFLYEAAGNLVVLVVRATDNPAWDLNLYSSSYSTDGEVSLFYEDYGGLDGFSVEIPGYLDSRFADIQFNVSTTAITCPAPMDLVVDHVGTTDATVSWTAGEGTTVWDVFVTNGESPGDDTPAVISGVNSTVYTFTGLNSLTNYTAYVRANCDDDVSAWKSISFWTAPDFGGYGTAEMPYLLYTKDDLEALSMGMVAGFTTTGKYFKIMNDIEGVTTPISGDFRGDFNGNGHTITLDLEGSGSLALFTTLGLGATIHDLIVDGTIISTGENAAGFVAELDGDVTYINWTIDNCVNRASITSNADNVGGFVGYSYGNISISNCINRGAITTTGNKAGGFIGICYGDPVILNCENRGSVSCSSVGGGIAGYLGGNIINCANKGSVTCSDTGGGIIGRCNGAIVRNCYNIGVLTFGTNSGGISGYNINHATIENCYNGGMITAENDANCGALSGFNFVAIYSSGGENHSYNHNNYYREGTYSVPYGLEGDLTYTDNFTSFIQEGTATECTLAEPMQGTTDLLTALNNWRDGDDTYAQWYADTYGNNQYMPAFTEGTPPGLEISPNPIVMSPRPIGAWMRGEVVSLVNTSLEDLQVTGIEFDNAFFLVDESAGIVSFPFTIEAEQSKEIYVGTDPAAIVSEGTVTAQLSTVWNQTQVKLADIEVLNYMPVSPDVVEMAEIVTSLPQTITQSTDNLYDNYKLPGNHPDGPDAVYQLVFAEGALLNAQITSGSNAKLALYHEDFNGKPGPMADNYCIGGDDPIANFMVLPGTYYLVVSSTSPQFILELTTDALPTPVAATLVGPDNGAIDITSPLVLDWQFGAFAAEYQLLIGNSNPPTDVLVDWTSDLSESYVIDNLSNNRIYYWRVNERNATGVTEGPVWHFTTILNSPINLQANTAVYVGDDILLRWTTPIRSLIGYNVYQDGVKINAAPLTVTEYIVSDLAYNMDGYNFTVTAVYDEGESVPSNAVLVRVGGIGMISGTVLEQDGAMGIANATVTIIGYDEFLVRHSYVCNTDGNGNYAETVCTGSYLVFAAMEGYQENHIGSCVTVNYDAQTNGVDIVLYEEFYPVGSVVAQYDPDTLDPQSPKVQVQWESVDIPAPLVPGWHTYCQTGFSHGISSPYTDQPKFGYQYPINVIAFYAGTTLTKVALFSDERGIAGGNYTCRIYIGGDKPEEGEMVSTITVDLPARVGDWVEYDLETPVEISGAETVWVTWQVNVPLSNNPIPVCENMMSYGSWMDSDPEDVAFVGNSWHDDFSGSYMMKQYFINREEREFQSYNIYRSDCYDDANAVLVSSGITDTIYMDESWQTIDVGVYKWGVTRSYSGNHKQTRGEGENYFLNGLKAYSFSSYAGDVVPNGWIAFDPMHPRATASLVDGSLQLCAADFANDGYAHGFTNDKRMLTFDPGTGRIVDEKSINTIMNDVAFDYTTNTMYGVSNNILYTIDLSTGDVSAVSLIADLPLGAGINALACSYDGQLYGFITVNAGLFAIDKNNGNVTAIGASGHMLDEPDMSACFDHNTGRLFLVCTSSASITGGACIMLVDINNGSWTAMGNRLGIQRALCIPYEYAPAPITPESKMVWSNCLDKDMWTTVEVSVLTNTGASPEGTSVRFINTSEPGQGYDYIVTLDDSGYYSWDEFRKGTYNYTIEKDGYTSCGNHESIEIWEPTSLECLLEEIALQARNLYVSPTGWAQWQEGIGGDELHYDTDSFDGSVGASGASFYWAVKFKSSQLEAFNKVTSVSFYDAHDQPFNGTFYICSTENPMEHILYQKDIVTTGEGRYKDYPLDQDVDFDNSESLWIVFQFKKGEASHPASACSNTGDPNGRWISTNGINWNDVNNYGMNYTWKIRCHVKADGREEKQLEFYRVFLDGIFVENTTDTHFQHSVEDFEEGETHTTMVRAMYYSGVSEDATYTWTYTPCDNYTGPTDLTTEDLGDMAILNWTLPENQISGGEWSYYDNDYNAGAVGVGGPSFYWGIMLPAGTWSGQYLGKVAVFNYAAFTGNILIYQGGETAPETLVYSQQYESMSSGHYVEYLINRLVELDESQNLWIVVNNVTSANYPAAYCDDMGDANARWISMNGSTWHDLTEYDISGTWMIRAYTTDEMPVVYNILGTMVFRDGELLTETPLPRNVLSYADIQADPGYHEYGIRVVYDDLPIYQGDYYAMSCMETESVTVGVTETESDEVNVYPNPVNDELTVQAAGMTHIRIVNALGQIVYDTDIKADETRIPMQRFASGVYVIHIATDNGAFVRRVVVAGR